MSLDRLPNEILLVIFRSIDDLRERARLELVCRRWRQIMRGETADGKLRWDGWKNVRRIDQLRNANLIMPFGVRCGAHLVECCFAGVNLDSSLIHLITEHFPALMHLYFRCCMILNLDANAMESFRELCARIRIRSLAFTEMKNGHLLNYQFLDDLPRLQHLGLYLYSQFTSHSLPSRFSAELRSLYLNCHTDFSPVLLVQMLTKVQNDSPRLEALYLDAYYKGEEEEQLMGRISAMKNLRFLHLSHSKSESLCSCLNNLPKLVALQMKLSLKNLPDLFRSPSFRGLVHLRLFLYANPSAGFNSIGHLATILSQLRSLTLGLAFPMYFWDQSHEIGCQVLKMANNGILEHLNVPCASFTIGMLGQLVRDCPNLHSFCARLGKNEQLPHVVELRRVVEEQWRAGKRKHVPLRVWIHAHSSDISFRHRDPFLTVHTIPPNSNFVPLNPVLDELFRDEIFKDNGIGEKPSFLMKYYVLKAMTIRRIRK